MSPKNANLPDLDIADLAKSYREWSKFDDALSPAKVRTSLRRMSRDLVQAADILRSIQSDWVDIAHHTPARAAWLLVNATSMGLNSPSPLVEVFPIAQTLQGYADLATTALKHVPKTRYRGSAVPIVAGSLCARRRHLGLTVSCTYKGATVEDFISIARSAGDRTLTKDAAQKALKAVIKTFAHTDVAGVA